MLQSILRPPDGITYWRALRISGLHFFECWKFVRVAVLSQIFIPQQFREINRFDGVCGIRRTVVFIFIFYPSFFTSTVGFLQKVIGSILFIRPVVL